MNLRVAYIGNTRSYSSTYGEVYCEAGLQLGRLAPTQFQSFIDTSRVNSRKAVLGEAYVKDQLDRLTAFNPHVVFFDPNIDLGTIRMERVDIEKKVLEATNGKVERVGECERDDISFKDSFYLFCLEHGIPTPDTIILRDWDRKRLEHGALAQELGCSSQAALIYKKVFSSSGADVHLIRNNEGLQQLLRESETLDFVVQNRIITGPVPFSLRIVTFGTIILGGVLLINPKEKVCSNARKGAVKFDLATPEEATGRDGIFPEDERYKFFDIYWRIFQQANISPFNRKIPDRIAVLARKIGAYQGANMLRGTDFIFDESGRIYALESNCHPGPPSSGMWLDMKGETFVSDAGISKREWELDIAARMMAMAIVKNAA